MLLEFVVGGELFSYLRAVGRCVDEEHYTTVH